MKQISFSPALPAVALAKAGTLFLFSFLLVTACGNKNKQIEALDKETMVVHDEAMKDMADMNRVARELKQTLTVATMTPEQSAVYTDVLTAIGKAENEMMDWMKNYKSPDGMPDAYAIKYLQEQKALIEKNRSDIRAALEAGRKLQEK
ncbi:MAG: hypothetical protein ACKVUS_08415 [Saprospiraceae bacterium]